VGSHRLFRIHCRVPPAGNRAGDILADSTILTTLFGVDESQRGKNLRFRCRKEKDKCVESVFKKAACKCGNTGDIAYGLPCGGRTAAVGPRLSGAVPKWAKGKFSKVAFPRPLIVLN
jgi:hypothetical protein